MTPDWDGLRAAAKAAAQQAYAPDSRLRVGAAALVGDGRGLSGRALLQGPCTAHALALHQPLLQVWEELKP